MPLIPSQGSVGASGDLAPLAHLIAALMGYGRIDVRRRGRCAAGAALERLGLEPLQLGPKEGLALINGTQASTALALDALFQGERVFAAAIAAGALSVDALKGSAKPFDPRISALRGQPGQIRVAAAIHDLLEGSEILTSHVEVQPGAGPLQLPLPAAGDGRLARPAPECRADADHRGGRGHRQSDRLRRRRHARSPAAISTPSRSPSPPTRSPSRCARSARSRSAASASSSIRR